MSGVSNLTAIMQIQINQMDLAMMTSILNLIKLMELPHGFISNKTLLLLMTMKNGIVLLILTHMKRFHNY